MALPTELPGRVRVLKDGAEVDLARLESFSFEDVDIGTDKAKFSFDNEDLSVLEDPTWRRGQRLTVSWGTLANMKPPRDVIVEGFSGLETLEITTRGVITLMNRVKKTRAFKNMTDSEVATQVAEENGYAGAAARISATTRKRGTVNQIGVTDAVFLASLARRHGFIFNVRDTGMYWGPRNLDARPSVSIGYRGADADAQALRAGLDSDIEAATGAVALKGLDPETGKQFETEAKSGDSGHTSLSDTHEVPDGRTAMWQIEKWLGSSTGGAASHATKEEAKEEADRRFDQAAKRRFTMKIDIEGAAAPVFAATIARLVGFGAYISGNYYVEKVNDSIDGSGYVSSIELNRDGPSKSPESTDEMAAKDKVNDAGKKPGEGEMKEVLDPRTSQWRLQRSD